MTPDPDAWQPFTRDGQDPQIVGAVWQQLLPTLLTGETVQYIAVTQKINPVSVVFTNKRLLLIGEPTFADHPWRDFSDIRVQDSAIESTLVTARTNGQRQEIGPFPKAQGVQMHRVIREQEEAAYEAALARGQVPSVGPVAVPTAPVPAPTHPPVVYYPAPPVVESPPPRRSRWPAVLLLLLLVVGGGFWLFGSGALHSPLAPPPSNPPTYIKQLTLYKDGSKAFTAYFILADKDGVMTTGEGRATLTIEQPRSTGGSTVLYSREFAISRSDFQRMTVGQGAFAHEVLLAAFGRIPYSMFIAAPTEFSGTAHLVFRPFDGSSNLEADETLIFDR